MILAEDFYSDVACRRDTWKRMGLSRLVKNHRQVITRAESGSSRLDDHKTCRFHREPRDSDRVILKLCDQIQEINLRGIITLRPTVLVLRFKSRSEGQKLV